jgi:hypothetical protein
MTHATRIVAVVAVLIALAVGAPVQAQTPEIDALRVRAEAGVASAQNDLGFIIRLALTAARGTGYNGSLYRRPTGRTEQGGC